MLKDILQTGWKQYQIEIYIYIKKCQKQCYYIGKYTYVRLFFLSLFKRQLTIDTKLVTKVVKVLSNMQKMSDISTKQEEIKACY